MSSVSVVLYSFVAVLALERFLKFHGVPNEMKSWIYKKYFFGVLFFSALADIPFWLTCLAYKGPSTCVVENSSFPIFLCFHFMALCGYAFCLGITVVLWSDVITDSEDKPFLHVARLDIGRNFYFTCFLLYCINEFCLIVSVMVYMDSGDPNGFIEKNDVYKITALFEPIIITLFAGGCLRTGIKLQRYVVSVKLATEIQREFLIQLNLVLFAVTTCYLIRAIFVFTKFDDFGNTDLRSVSFGVWTLCTRWLPNIGSSLCLLVFMSRSHSGRSSRLPWSVSKTESYHSATDPLLHQIEPHEVDEDDVRLGSVDPIGSPSPVFYYCEDASRSSSVHSADIKLPFPNIFEEGST